MNKLNFQQLRKLSGMTLKAFSEYFGIPIRTIEDWSTEKREPTPYLLELMEYKLRNEGLIK